MPGKTLTLDAPHGLAAEVYELMQRFAANDCLLLGARAGNRLMEIGDQLTAELVIGCETLDELLSKWSEHNYRPTLQGSEKALLLADIYDFVAAKRRIEVTAYRGIDAGKKVRITPRPIDALQGAIDMLNKIKEGGSYTLMEFHERVQSYQDTLDAMHHQANIDERNRTEIRKMGEQRRQA